MRLQHVRPSISDLSQDDAVALITSLRADRRRTATTIRPMRTKVDVSLEPRTRTKSDPMKKISASQAAKLLAQLQAKGY